MAEKLTADNPPSTNPSASSATTTQSIPSHPAPTDAAATSSGVTADAQNPEAVPTTSKTNSDDRAMRSTSAWKPSLDRRQSWNKEDQKRALQMTGVSNVKTGPGFSENT